MEIDTNNTGAIDFSEYFEWIVKSFGLKNTEDPGGTPAQQYYLKIRPRLGQIDGYA